MGYSLKSIKIAPWWDRTYLLDWIVMIVVLIVVMGVTTFVSPFHRYLPENDAAVNYPKVADIVPDWVLGILWFGCLGAIAIAQIFKRHNHDLHHAILSLCICICITNIVTNSIKSAAGRYRPNWLSTYSEDDLNEGRLSFPSGHASNSFGAMMWLVLFVLGKVNAFSERYSSSFALTAIVSSPLAVSTFVAVSRTVDYHHNFSDILAGSLIGIAAAYFGYFHYYPKLSSSRAGQPKMPYRAFKAVSETTPLGLGNNSSDSSEKETSFEVNQGKADFV